jgi:hypothetical protein
MILVVCSVTQDMKNHEYSLSGKTREAHVFVEVQGRGSPTVLVLPRTLPHISPYFYSRAS